MHSIKVLLVEDDAAEASRLERHLRESDAGARIVRATDPISAVNQFRRNRPEVVVLDLSLNGYGPAHGLELISQFQRIDSSARIIVLTGHTDEDIAMTAIRNGATSFLIKPTSALALQALVVDFAQTARFKRQMRSPRPGEPLAGFVGRGAAMQTVYRLIEQCAQTDSNVFIVGETGTGKELVAKAIHKLSRRKAGPLSVYFGSVPSGLADAELFGYVRGAFTGASSKGVEGSIQKANHGTLFIDELDSLEISVQRKLLRAIEEKTYKPIGAQDYSRSEFRLISAAQPRIFDLVESGEFREDLLSRVEVITIAIPPLRDRQEDIPDLVDYFLADISRERGPAAMIPRVSERALEKLTSYHWPRNVRQLSHVLQHGALQAGMRGADEIDVPDIAERLRDLGATEKAYPAAMSFQPGKTLRENIERVEREIIADSLARNNNLVSAVCQELGLGRTTLWRKLRQYELEQKSFS